jgi:arsenate reductase
VHPCAIAVMIEVGIDISAHRAKSLDEFDDALFDYVVTMCADAQENCPIFPRGATYLHNPFDDPVSVMRSDSEHCFPFRHVRDKIKDWIEIMFAL